jgi:hypothetical protein
VDTYSVSPSLPAGLSINASTGVISGTPSAVAASATYTVTAANAGGSTTTTVTVEVVAPPAPVLSSATSVTGTVGTAFSYQIAANHSPTGYGATGLPGGLSVNTGTGLISGTPTTPVFGGSFTVTATNAGGTGSQSVAVTLVHFLESALGDFSGDTGAPSSINLGTSSKSLLGSVGGSDVDYLTFTVPAGYRLDAIWLRSYQSTDNVAFMAIDSGATWTAGYDQAEMLGNSHFGESGDVNTDMLTKMRVAGSSLAAGTYTMWIQQLGAATTYGLEFELTALPTGSTFAGWSGGAELNSANVGKYAIGGATSSSAASERPVAGVDSNVLSLTAIVRTNDGKLAVVGEAGGSLSNWSSNGVSVTASTNTNGVPDGCQRQVFSVERTNSPSRQFLRLKATLAP